MHMLKNSEYLTGDYFSAEKMRAPTPVSDTPVGKPSIEDIWKSYKSTGSDEDRKN